MDKQDQPVYLSLADASRELGVHTTTLRRWADTGQIPVYVTPGGHRRFAIEDIEALRVRKPLAGQALATTWARRALDQARTELKRVEQSPAWLAHLSDEDRVAWRRVSMQLMGVVLRYVSLPDDAGDDLLHEARMIGESYVQNALQANLPLTTALEVALFFRDSLVDAAMDMPAHANLHPEASARLLRRISRVLNVVQLTVVAGYEVQVRTIEH